MKLLLTGATGSLGSRLVERWAGTHELTGTGRKEYAGKAKILFARGDLSDAAFAEQITRGQEVVVHCAALASAWGDWESFYSANVIATKNVVEGCRKNGVRQLVHISTPSIYYAPEDRRGIREEDPLPPPATHYAKSKLLAEELVRGSGLQQTVILRPRGIFGPTDQVILPKILRLIRRGRFPLLRGGKSLVDLTHVDNVALALDACLTRAAALNGETIHLSNGEPISVRELVEKIAALLKLPVRMVPLPLPLAFALAGLLEKAYSLAGSHNEPPLTLYGLGLLAYDQTLDLSKARRLLSYAPAVSLNEGITSTLEGWQ